MEKKKIIIIIAIMAVIAIIIGAGLSVVTSSTLYKDNNIQVEVPYGTQFNLTEKLDSNVVYKSENGVEISILTPTSDSSYEILKDLNVTNNIKKPLGNTTYNGNIYTLGNGSNTRYQIYLNFDDMKMIAILTANDLDTVINMANTFKLLKKFNISHFDGENTTTNETSSNINNNKKNSSDTSHDIDTVVYEGVEYGADDVKPFGYYDNEKQYLEWIEEDDY